MPTPDPGIQASPAVSVVLPVLDEEKDIGRLLAEVLHQEDPPGGFEVLVADGGSRDRTRAIVAALSAQEPRLRLLHNPGVRSSAGRNVGAREARGTYVLFLDGHCSLPRRDYLARLVEIFASSGAHCLCRPQPLMGLADGTWSRAIATARHSWLGHNPGSDIYRQRADFTDPRSAGAAYLRCVLVELGGYDERFDACEDVEFNHRLARAGLKAYVHPDLRIDYRPRQSLRDLWRQMQRYGRGRARLWARHPRLVPWPLVAITAAGLGLLGSGFLVGWGVMVQVAGLLGLAWGAAAALEGLRLAGLSRQAIRVGCVFPVLHAGLLLGFWGGLAEAPRYRHDAGAWVQEGSGGREL